MGCSALVLRAASLSLHLLCATAGWALYHQLSCRQEKGLVGGATGLGLRPARLCKGLVTISGAGREVSLTGCGRATSGTGEVSYVGGPAVQDPPWSLRSSSVTDLDSSSRLPELEFLSRLKGVRTGLRCSSTAWTLVLAFAEQHSTNSCNPSCLVAAYSLIVCLLSFNASIYGSSAAESLHKG